MRIIDQCVTLISVLQLVSLLSTGRYIYFDASQSKGKARFSTPYSIHSHTCLKFHYHMTDMHTGRLNVYATDTRGHEQLLWRLFGERDRTWREASIPLNDIHPQYQVPFYDCYTMKWLHFGHCFNLFRKQLRYYTYSYWSIVTFR